ncbi:hypothetical protein DIJ62_33295, partial [Burkholderia pseudomallei]
MAGFAALAGGVSAGLGRSVFALRPAPGGGGPVGEGGGQHAQRRRADAVAHGRAREIGRQIEHRRHAG